MIKDLHVKLESPYIFNGLLFVIKFSIIKIKWYLRNCIQNFLYFYFSYNNDFFTSVILYVFLIKTVNCVLFNQ